MDSVIEDIRLTELRRIDVAGGDVMHALKAGEPDFVTFGEAYFSCLNPGAVKGWKRHRRMTMNLIVPLGLVRFVFWDGRPGVFSSVEIGEEGNYSRLCVPPGLWFGFKGCSKERSLVLNIASHEHDSFEVDRLPLDAVNYDWE
jgi:dTDP-4-dehydrorhamnose 3,5-epimerase